MRLPLFVEREELFAAWAPLQAAAGGAPDVAAVLALCRVYGAALGLSTAIGKASKADYTARKNDPIAYGGDVYSFLRENGANQPDIIRRRCRSWRRSPNGCGRGRRRSPKPPSLRRPSPNSEAGGRTSR